MIATRITTLLLLCCTPLFVTPASARPAKHHYRHIARQFELAANVFAPFADRHALDGAHSYGAFPMGPFATGAVAGASRGTVRQRRMNPVAANSFASASAANPAVAGMSFGGGSSLVSEARRYIGGNPTGRSSLWCGNFMNLVLERTGHPGSSSNMARSFASYGTRVSGPQVGAIAVMSRGANGGHVGVVSGIDANGNPIIISGNHGHRVAESVYPRGRIYAYVMP